LILHGTAAGAAAAKWLQLALDVFSSFYPFYGGRDGGWAEGTFYASSYAKWYLPFFLALEQQSGFSFLERPYYRRAAQFFMHFAPPGWEVHPFCDGSWCLPDDEEWPGFFAQNPFRVYADRFGPELAQRFSRELAAPELYKLHLLDIFLPGSGTTAALLEEHADSRHFRDAGFVSMHSDIAQPAADTAVLTRASRYGNTSHQACDQGNVAIISRGRGLVVPSGYFGAAYGSPHHGAWTQQTKAHNCPLFDGVGQPRHDVAAIGRILWLRDVGTWAATCMDLGAAYPMLSRFARLVVLVRPGLVIVQDQVEAPAPVAASWLLHTLSPPSVADGTVSVARDPAQLHCRLFAGAELVTAVTVTDQFETGVNDNVPAEFHVDCPDQHHLSWEIAPGRAHLLTWCAAVDTAELSTHASAGGMTVRAGAVSADFLTSAAGGVRVDGRCVSSG
jgi:hypothetical protein